MFLKTKRSKLTYEQVLLDHRIEVFKQKDVKIILDVGANTGQFAESILKSYPCHMFSFEPMLREFEALRKKTNNYKNWRIYHYGLGDQDQRVDINISKNSYSSSILELEKETINIDANIGYCSIESTEVKRLDSVWNSLELPKGNVLLKIDTQGYEKKVLEGCRDILDKIMGIQIEMSLFPLYLGEALFDELFSLIRSKGFNLYVIEPGYKDPKTGKLLQLEAVFFRS